jgi:hypothetical protein
MREGVDLDQGAEQRRAEPTPADTAFLPTHAGTKQHDLMPQEMPATYLHRSFTNLVT